MRVAVCFACDEAYFPLCKGLVLSLGEAARFFNPAWDVSLHFIDIGCRDESLSFLTRHGAAVHAFDRRAHLLDFSRYGRMYLEKRLLYRQGDYLTQAERAALVGLVKRPA